MQPYIPVESGNGFIFLFAMLRLRLPAGLPLGLLVAFYCMASYADDGIVKLERGGKAPLFYIATTPSNATKVGAILFAGGAGELHLADAKDASNPTQNGNFLIRSRKLFSEHGIATAAFDPSDDSGPLEDAVRRSDMHAEEVAAVIADFKRRFGLEHVFLVGTSRGTISAAYVSLPLHDAIDGVVLTSTVFEASRRGTGLSGFNLARIKAPLLIVHHRRDACRTTPPEDAERLQDEYTVLMIDGGSGSGGNGDECGPFSAHGYLGKESKTVAAISDWIHAHTRRPQRQP